MSTDGFYRAHLCPSVDSLARIVWGGCWDLRQYPWSRGYRGKCSRDLPEYLEPCEAYRRLVGAVIRREIRKVKKGKVDR